MKEIARIEAAAKAQSDYEKAQINHTLYWAYWESKNKGCELIDFDDLFRGNEIPEIVSQLRELGVEEFTISSTWSSLLESIKEFTDLGCSLGEMVTITKTSKWGDVETKPALLMKTN